MNLQKLKKFKDELERIIQITINKAKKENIDINSEDFKDKLKNIKERLITKFGVSENDYNKVENLLEVEQSSKEINIEKELLSISKELSDKKTVEKNDKKLNHAFNRLLKLEKRDINWNDIRGKPKLFTQEDIKDLSFSQIKHTDIDHIDIARSVNEILSDNAITRRQLLEQENQIRNIKVFEYHNDLEGIGPDDHHSEKHNLESHIDSKLMYQLKRMVTGEYVDDLHKHFIQREELPRIIDIAGITKNDADSWYVIGDGVRKMTVGTTEPTSPAIGDLWIDTT